jgi:hypothetical protein
MIGLFISTAISDISLIIAGRIRSKASSSISENMVTYMCLIVVLPMYVFGLSPVFNPTRPAPECEQTSTLLQFAFPASNSSIKDLDQVVAALSGATILAYNIVSALHCRYKMKRESDAAAREIRRRNDIRLRRILVQYDS